MLIYWSTYPSLSKRSTVYFALPQKILAVGPPVTHSRLVFMNLNSGALGAGAPCHEKKAKDFSKALFRRSTG